MPGEVTLRATLGRPYLAVATTPQVAYVLLEIQPAQTMASVRMPINVSFVLDHSGSMKGEKIELLRRAVATALDQLDPQDTVSVVIFDHRSEVLIPSTRAQNKRALFDTIAQIQDAGGTYIAPAIAKGLREIEKGPQDGVRRLILLTDGQTEHEQEFLRRAEDAGKQGVPLTALGVGDDWNEDLMIEAGTRSGGSADYIASPQEVIQYFQTTVQRAQATAVRNTEMTVRLVQGVRPRAIWQVTPLITNMGYKPVSERDVSVAIGDLETGQGATLLLELLVDPRPAGQYRIGQAEIRYDIPAMQVAQEKERVDLLLTFTSEAALQSQVHAPVMNIIEKVSAFKLQTRALQDIQAGDVAGATQKLQSAVTRLLSQGEVDLAQTMQREVENLQQSGQMSSEGQKTIKFGARKTVRLSDLNLPQS